MPIDITKIDAIVFDLGGVLLNIDHQAPINAFKALGIPNFDQLYSKVNQTTLFTDFETGVISPELFRDGLRAYLPVDLSDDVIDQAWNSIILNFPESRIRMLERLKTEYHLFLLSNTNINHFQVFNHRLKANFGYGSLSELMESTYYSHQLGLRKPNPAIFEHVLTDAQLNPMRTLFIDDTEEHILAAQALGLQTHHLKEDEEIVELLNLVK